jgi:hypothetical protein
VAFEGEKIFTSAQNIKYVFQPSEKASSHLVVVFSAFNPKGTAPSYNYIRTLQTLDVNKLFILDDYGDRGCYYLGKSRLFDIEASVVSLIAYLANQNNILHQNIICCGTSKGGFTSLYFGIKYGFGYVIAGAPQTKLGTYLTLAKELPTLEFISGGIEPDCVDFLDRLLYQVVDDSIKIPETYIHVGEGDHHYRGHVLPLKNYLNDRGFDCTLDIKDYSDHGDVSFYQSFLTNKLIDIIPSLKDSILINSVEVDLHGNFFKVQVNTNKPAQYALYVHREDERIDSKWYTNNPKFEYTAKDPGAYYFSAFAKDENGKVTTVKTKKYNI